jgi:hypothetical protein
VDKELAEWPDLDPRLTDDEQDAALEEALNLANPGRKEIDEANAAWRGRHGSKLLPVRDGWWFQAGRLMFANTPGRAGDFIRERYSAKGVIRCAEKLDAECYPQQLPEADLARFLALRLIVGSVWRSARKRAAEAALPFEITMFEAEDLLWEQRMVCTVSGLPFREQQAGPNSFRSPFRPSLDRITPAKGYVKGNVRLVLTLVNLAMNDWGADPLIEVAKAIVKLKTA